MYQAARIWVSLFLNLTVIAIPGNLPILLAINNPGEAVVNRYYDTSEINTTSTLGRVTERIKYRPWYISYTDTVPSIVFMLAPDLTVKTKVFGTAKNMAQVSFYYGELMVYTGAVIQTSPIIVTTDDIIVGFLQINKGVTITLGIPSSTQPGQIMLKAQYITKDHPLTTYNGLIATWTL